jgi:spermidine synthase
LYETAVLEARPEAATRPLTLLGAVFFISGFATLIYQIAWQRLLTVYYGVGPVSIAVIVSVFLLGLGIGSLAGGWIAERVRRLVVLYAAIEIALGVYGLASLSFLDFLGRTTAGSSYALTALFSASFLLPPTVLMGATLPIVLKLYNRHTGTYLYSLSFLYFVNTLGAAFGSLVAAYVFISLFDLDGAVGFAVLLNLLLASVVLLTMRGADFAPTVAHVRVPATELLGGAAQWLVFVTGFIAIGYEIAWTLNISSILKSSPYMFATILFVYLMGIAVGSYAMNRVDPRLSATQKRSLFFLLQVLIAVTASLPIIGYKWLVRYTFLGPLAAITDGSELHPPLIAFSAGWDYLWTTWSPPEKLFSLLDIFFWPLLFLLFPTILMGASFPLIAYLANANADKEAKATGIVYFINVLGNFAGTLITGFILLPYFGSEATFLILALLGIFFGFGVTMLGRVHVPITLRGGIVTILALWMYFAFPSHGGFLYTPVSPQAEAAGTYLDEGQSGIVNSQVSERGFGLAINGLGHGGRHGMGFGEGFPAFYIEAYGALRAARTIDDVLIIGFGTGSGSEAILTADDVKRLTLVEINETLIKHLRRHSVFRDIFNDRRVRLVVDDARRLLYRESTKYDVVLMDPLRPTTVYSNNIYSKEFYELVKRRLKPGGIIMTWVNSAEQMNTVASVFPYVRQECSIYVLGSDQPIVHYRDVEAIIRSKLPERGQRAITERRKLCPAADNDIKFDKAAPILTDKQPVAEYHLGRFYHIWRARSAASFGAAPIK